MKIAILIEAYKQPDLYERLIKRLEHPNVDIYVHIDKKVDIQPFIDRAYDVHYIEDRVCVEWGGFSQVECTINSLREILNSKETYSHIMLISAQDYPIVAIDTIVKELISQPDKEFIRVKEVSKYDWSVEQRMRKYRFRNRFIDILSVLSPISRKVPHDKIFGGSAWWALTSQCVDYILDYCSDNKKIINYYNHVHCSSEHFFQTIIMNSPFNRKIVNDSMRYVDWSGGNPNPKILTVNDFENIIKSRKWFARKFDQTVDTKILDMLDQNGPSGKGFCS